MNQQPDKDTLLTHTFCSKEDHCDYFELMLTISKEILSSLDIKEITHSLYSHLNRVMDAPIFAIGLYNEAQSCLDFWGVRQCTEALRIGSLPLENDKIWSVSCFLLQEEIICNSTPENSDMSFSRLLFSYANEERQSFVYLPLTSNKSKVGVLTVQSFHQNAFQSVQLMFLRNLANYITIAIEKAQAFKKIEEQKTEIEIKSAGLEIAMNHLEEIVSLRTEELQVQKEALSQQSERLVALNKELERLSIVARETDNAIMIMNQSGDVLWINDCFTRIYGYSLEQFIAARGSNIRQTSFCVTINELLDKCIVQKTAVQYQALNISNGGKQIWTQTSLTPILDDNGAIQYLVAIDSDITKIKEAESRIIEQATNIKQSIQYASNIQRSVLPSIPVFKTLFADAFVFFKPRDIVSGDFYWYHNKGNCTWVMVADCTGHGVPGALMSVLGISLLQEISRNLDYPSAGEVLTQLRGLLCNALQQSRGSIIHDGIDAALIIIDHEKDEMQYAGAFNPMILIRNNQLVEFTADKMPIGEHVKSNGDFTTQHIDYQKNDAVYLFSDGFASQFGGPNQRKYMRRRMYDFILANSALSMTEQQRLLELEHEQWNGASKEQTDDILVVGIRL